MDSITLGSSDRRSSLGWHQHASITPSPTISKVVQPEPFSRLSLMQRIPRRARHFRSRKSILKHLDSCMLLSYHILNRKRLLIFYSVAGSHTTGSSLTLLFYHMLRNPSIIATVVKEMDTQLTNNLNEGIYEFSGLEAKLPYTLACLREGFRVTPISAHLIPRLVASPEGLQIGDELIPQGVRFSNA